MKSQNFIGSYMLYRMCVVILPIGDVKYFDCDYSLLLFTSRDIFNVKKIVGITNYSYFCGSETLFGLP